MDPCLSPTTFTPTTQDRPTPNQYTGEIIDWTFKQFTVVPDFCQTVYQCTDVQRVDGYQPHNTITCVNDLKIDLDYLVIEGEEGKLQFSASEEDYRTGKYYPGEYEVTICGVVLKNPTDQQCATFILELLDPCAPPTSVT